MHVLFLLIPLLAHPFSWNTHNYPKTAERSFLAICREQGGTKSQCACNLEKGEEAWTVKQAIEQGRYYLKHKKLTDEAWKIHSSCLPKARKDL
jgi:hypothetical protein